LHKELKNQREEVELQDDRDCSAQGSRKKRKVIPSNTEEDFSVPDQGKNPEKSQGKPKKKKSPVKIKVEIDEGMQKAQEPDTTMSKKDQEETSSKPPPPGQTSTILEEPGHHRRSTCRKTTGRRQVVNM
jgi:hypothetical protein